MTIFYPDVSNYNGGLTIQPGTVAVCAKATEGRTFVDGWYNNFRDQAAKVGAFFFAYHWLHHGNVDAQAAHCSSIVGSTPVMIDCEDTTDHPTVADCIAFADGIRARGGVCTTVYMPEWYWQSIGSPDLRPLAAAGLHLVSSNYTTYSDTGSGWSPYGGVTPAIWQYSSTFPYGGRAVDINAFRGSVDDLRTLVTGGAPAMADLDYTNTQTYAVPDDGGRSAKLMIFESWKTLHMGLSAYGDGEGVWLVETLNAIKAAVGQVTTPTVTQDQVDAAVSKVMHDPAWIEQVAAALAGHIHVS